MALTRDGVTTSPSRLRDAIVECRDCDYFVPDEGEGASNRARSRARRHAAKLAHRVAISSTRVVEVYP